MSGEYRTDNMPVEDEDVDHHYIKTHGTAIPKYMNLRNRELKFVLDGTPLPKVYRSGNPMEYSFKGRL